MARCVACCRMIRRYTIQCTVHIYNPNAGRVPSRSGIYCTVPVHTNTYSTSMDFERPKKKNRPIFQSAVRMFVRSVTLFLWPLFVFNFLVSISVYKNLLYELGLSNHLPRNYI